MYCGEGPSDAYLTQVWLAMQIQVWLPEETTVHVALLLEGEMLKILDDLLLHEQSNWEEIEGALCRHVARVDMRGTGQPTARREQKLWHVHSRHTRHS